MGLMVQIVFLVLKVCAMAGSVVLQESSGHKISPSPAKFSAGSPIIEGSPNLVTREEQTTSDSPSPTSQPNRYPHFKSAPAPQTVIGPEPSSSAIPPLNEPPHANDPTLPPDAAVPVSSPPSTLPYDSPRSPTTLTVPLSSLSEPHVSPVSTSPPHSKSKPRHYAPAPANPTPLVHNARPPDPSFEPAPPAKSYPPPSSLPLYPQSPAPSVFNAPPQDSSYEPSPSIKSRRNDDVPPSPNPVPFASPPTTPQRNLPLPHPTIAEPPSNLQDPFPNLNRGRDIAPVSSSQNRRISISPTQNSPMKVPSVHKDSSSSKHALPDSSHVSTPPTKSHTAPALPSYPSPPGLKSNNPRHHPSSHPNPVPIGSPPYPDAKAPPSPSASYPPPGLRNKPRHHGPPPPNPDSSFESTPPTESHHQASLSPLSAPRPPGLPRHDAPPPPNSAPLVHNARPPDPSFESTPPAKSYPPPSLPPLYPPQPPVPLASPPTAPQRNLPLPHPTMAEPPSNLQVPSVHNAPSSTKHAPPDSSYESTLPTKSHTPPLLPSYPPPPGLKSDPRHHSPPHPNPAPSVHDAPPDSRFDSTPPTKSHLTPSLSPLYPPPPPGLPRHHAHPPPNPVPIGSPPSKLQKTFQPIHHNSTIPPSKMPSLSVHNASSSYNHAPSPDATYEFTLPTKSHAPPSLSLSYPPPPGLRSTPSHHGPPPPNPDSSFESTPPTKSHHQASLSPLSVPWPPGLPRHDAPLPPNSVPPFGAFISPATSPSAKPIQPMPFLSPKISPLLPSPSIPKPIQALPPPPPNEDCSSITCKEPLTNTPPGTPCNCVMPMQIELGLGVALYTFFPLVSELAFEMASGVYMKPSQVRIMGANADDQDPEKINVLIDLVPIGDKFDNFTAFQTAQRLWLKQVPINSSLFGDYEVLYVKYPGLPPSPPTSSSNIGANGGPDGHGNDGMMKKPLAVDVSKQRHSNKLSGSIIAIISLSATVAMVLFCIVIWVLLFKRRVRSRSEQAPAVVSPPLIKSSGNVGSTSQNGPMSACTGSANTFSLSDILKATDDFNESKVLGEGGFGRVYSGLLDDGTKVAVKVLKRVGQQGGREFLAEVEMLSRLHHRNLVRLIGICTDETNRCLVYELVPNGSVESHLHGNGKVTGPLNWAARLKIALGAARGLAYLHEDSSPRVIHRDFKASNILLEHDFTPKVSDFGLARTALDEENSHITTRVMGTFGYVAPEYAMTGHLLVKSDVYSYGVVLLELLTGRKPVDMSMPLGQENLVVWARPLLAGPEGLALLIDPMLSHDAPFNSTAKVAAIASMCVQTEVSHRPFMGEVVQALKLVCNECEETTDLGSTPVGFDDRTSPAWSDLESGCLELGLGPVSG